MTCQQNDAGKVICLNYPVVDEEDYDSGEGSDGNNPDNYIPGFDFVNPELFTPESITNSNLVKESLYTKLIYSGTKTLI